MGRAIVAGGKPAMEAPSGGLMLSTLAEGSIVKLNENGSPVEFYVAKHNYESGLNGTGRTLLVRKKCYDVAGFDDTNGKNAYASSTIDAVFNSTYKAVLSADVQEAIGETKFYYTPGNGTGSVNTLSRSVFALSLTELGKSDDYANVEGSALPIASALEIATRSTGATVAQWTRTPNTQQANRAYEISAYGETQSVDCYNDYGRRPCFTLPSTVVFDEETLVLKEVS